MPCNAWNSVGLGKTTAQVRTGMLQWCKGAHCFPRLKPCPKSRPGPNQPPSRTSCHKLEIDPLSNFLFIRIIKHHQTSWLGLLYSFVDWLNERHGPVWLYRFTSKTVGRKYRTVVNWKYRCLRKFAKHHKVQKQGASIENVWRSYSAKLSKLSNFKWYTL